MTKLIASRKAFRRYILPYHGGGQIAATAQTATAGDCYLLEFDVVERGTYADGITYTVDATSNGNVIAGIYRVVTEDTSEAATLVVQSSSTAQGSVSTPQTVTFTPTYLSPGRYYAALHFSSSTATYTRPPSGTVQAVGWSQKFNQSFGALPSTVPTPSAVTSNPGMKVRVVQP